MKQLVDFFPGDVRVASDRPDILAESARIANLAFARDIGREEGYAYPNAIVYDPASARDLTAKEKAHYLVGFDELADGNPLLQPEIYVGATALSQFVDQEMPKWLGSSKTAVQSAGLLTTTPAGKEGLLGLEGLHIDDGEYYGYRVGFPVDNAERDVLYGTRSPASLFRDIEINDPPDVPKSSSACRALLEEYPALLATVQVLIMPLGGEAGKIYRAGTRFVFHDGSTERYKNPSQMTFQFYQRQKPRR